MSDAVAGFWIEAALHPGRVAVVDIDGTPQTAGALLVRVNRLSNAMIAEGVRPGSTVAILTWNRGDTLALILAAFQVGAYFTMVNTHLAASEVAHILDDSPPRLLFVDHHTSALAKEAVSHIGLDRSVIRSLDADQGFATLDEWIAGQPDERPAERTVGAPVMYTSGTSGLPKGVRPDLSSQDPDVSAAALPQALLGRFGIDAVSQVGQGAHLVTSPLYHTAPMHNALAALHLGQRVVIMGRFDAETALRLIDEHAVTWTLVVPTMMRRMIDLPLEIRSRYDMSSVTRFIHAGAPCPVDLKRQVIDWLGLVVWEYYSSTEGGGAVIGADDWLAHPGSVGRPWLGADIRILDDEGSVVPAGEVGNIYFLNSRSFRYHNDPEKTAAVQRDGYVTAGDMGWVDEEGYLFIADRRTDLILVGGVNVYPAEVENALASHPSVADVAVIGKPDAELGETVHAVIEPRGVVVDPCALSADLSAHLEARLSIQKRPKSYEFRTELPRNETGKLLRRVLRDEPAG